MDILSSETVNYKLCANPACQRSRPVKDFHPMNDWCKYCIKAASKNAPPGEKFCLRCKEYKPLTGFQQKQGKRKIRISSWCRACTSRKSVEAHKKKYGYEANRERTSLKKYGMTLADYAAMLEAQGGVCAACNQPEINIHHRTKKIYPLVVDHDHTTKKVRGLLCNSCNRALGFAKEDPERLIALVAYIHKHNGQS